MLILGLEASTSSVKALLFDTNACVLKEVQRAYKSETADMVSMDAASVFDALMEVAKECISGAEEAVEGIAMATIWNSLLFYDEQMNPLGRIVTWADRSGSLEVFENRGSDFTETGCPQSYKYARWQLMRGAEQDKLRKASKVGFLSDYLYMRMTGLWCVTQMSATGGGLINLRTGEWDEAALEDIGLSSDMLPPLVDYKVKRPLSRDIAIELGLPEGISVGFPNGDGGLNQLGEGELEQGIMSMSVGTSAAVRVLTDQLPEPENEGIWWHYLEEGRYIAGAAIAGAGNCLDWYMKILNADSRSHEELVKSIEDSNIENAPIFLPFIYGEQSPGWQRSRAWGFTGDWSEQGYYSVLEGVLFNLYQGYEMISDSLGEPTVIKLSGGILKSPYWIQLAADVFNRPMVVSDIIHGSLYGAFSVMSDQMPLRENQNVVYPSSNAASVKRRYMQYLDKYLSTTISGDNLLRP